MLYLGSRSCGSGAVYPLVFSPGTTYLLLRPALALGALRDLWTIAVVEPQTAHLTSARVEVPDFHSRATLAELLGLPTQKLNWWLQGFPVDKRYRHFAVAKRGKGQRQIAAPIAPIKEMQRRLATAQTNAAVHVDQRWVFGIDLEDFFPTITERRVRGMFEAFPFEYSKEIAKLLAGLCCHRDSLPQGAPSSPIISNYICRGMDRPLAEPAIRHRCLRR